MSVLKFVLKETEEMCLVLISDLPSKGYSVEEVSNLVKPFGGLKDILILSSHKKVRVENSCEFMLSASAFWKTLTLQSLEERV